MHSFDIEESMYKYNMLEIKGVEVESCVIAVDTGSIVNYHTLCFGEMVKDLEFLRKEYDGSFHYESISSSYITNDIQLISEWILNEVSWFNKMKSVQVS